MPDKLKKLIFVTVLATAYGEVIKNLEITTINLQKERPLYQIINVPKMPF